MISVGFGKVVLPALTGNPSNHECHEPLRANDTNIALYSCHSHIRVIRDEFSLPKLAEPERSIQKAEATVEHPFALDRNLFKPEVG